MPKKSDRVMEIDRRKFLAGAGSSAAAFLSPNSALSAAGCDVDLETRCRIFDSSKDITTTAKQIAAAGAKTVIRFYSRIKNLNPHLGPYQNEVLSAKELEAIGEADLSVATVFQYFSGGSGRTFHDERKKVDDVKEALAFADRMNQPEHSTLYFGADFPLKPNDVTVVKQYFEYAMQEMSKHPTKWKIGVYGCGQTCEVLAAEGWEIDYWISASVSYWRTAEFYNSDNWTLFQTKTELGRSFGTIDTNILNPKLTSFGQWRVDGKPIADPMAISRKILDRRRFIQVPRLQLFSDPSTTTPIKLNGIDASRALQGRSVRVLCTQGDFVGVSFDETDNPLGFCRASHLGTTIPHFKQPWEH